MNKESPKNKLPDLCAPRDATEEVLAQREKAAAERAAANAAALRLQKGTLNLSVTAALGEGSVTISTPNILYGLVAMMYRDGDLAIGEEGLRDATQRMCDRMSDVIRDFASDVGLLNRQVH